MFASCPGCGTTQAAGVSARCPLCDAKLFASPSQRPVLRLIEGEPDPKKRAQARAQRGHGNLIDSFLMPLTFGPLDDSEEGRRSCGARHLLERARATYGTQIDEPLNDGDIARLLALVDVPNDTSEGEPLTEQEAGESLELACVLENVAVLAPEAG